MQINKLHHFYNRIRRQVLSHVVFTRVLFILLILLLVTGTWFVFRQQVQGLVSGMQVVAGKPLPETNGRTNILLLGSGGPGHDGPDLTDTNIFISIKADSGETTLISIPRDFWIPSLRAKINTAYHYGYIKEATSGGLLLAKSAVSEALGQSVHFVVNLDFSTFAKAIDLMGGVDITVDRAFTDDQYPIPGKENDLCDGDPLTKCRYETVQFTAGPQHMDGVTALKFVRSRHSTDPEEGTDFARSKRQEKIITAVKNKLLSINNLKNTKIYKELYDLAINSLVTDITPEYYAPLLKLSLKARQHPISTFTLTSPEQLDNPPISDKYDGQWVLIPKGGDPKFVYSYVSSLLQ
jgi:polyisoprenyl-teichoic acid--peptidoglycan teichoic acid transferase